MRLLSEVLVTLATVHCASCFFPLFFPGPIIYPKTTPAPPPTTEAPKPPPPPPPPSHYKKVYHVYKPSHSYGHHKSHYAPQSHYSPHYGNYHHFIEYDEGYPAEEYSKEEVEPPTTTTTTTTTTPEPTTTKKQHYYRLVYPKPPPLFYPHAPYSHYGGGHYGAPPAHPPPYFGHYKPALARKAPVKVIIAEPAEEKPKPKMKTYAPPLPMDSSSERMDSSEMKMMPMKTAYRPKYESAPRRRPPPGHPYPDQYQNPMLRRPSPVYKVAPQRRPSPNIPMRPYRPTPSSPPPVFETMEDEMVNREVVEPPTPGPTVPPKTRRPAPVYYVTPTTTTVAPDTHSEAPPVPSRLYVPPPDDYDQDASFGPPLFNFTSPQLMQISRRVDTQHRRVLNPPARLDGHEYEFWNKRDSVVNPKLEPTSFDTLSYNFIREMIANSTMSSITQNNG